MKATSKNPYPRTFEEFLDWFSTEQDCAKYLEWIRWPDGFVCPGCGAMKAWRTERDLWHCQGCQQQSSATAGTVFEDSRKPLRLWFHFMWLMMTQKTDLDHEYVRHGVATLFVEVEPLAGRRHVEVTE